MRNRLLSALTLAFFFGVCFVGAVDDIFSDPCRVIRSRRV